MIPLSEMDIGELAGFICNELDNHGISCVLSGGACVSIYSGNKYQSGDLDFIETGASQRKNIKEVLAELGFVEFNRYFRRDDVRFFIEFPSGPLSVGSERVREISEIEFSTGKLRLLSPTDCVKDRLAAFYHWDDRQSLEQAIMVSETQEIDIKEVERWSKVENCSEKFEKIRGLFLF